MPKIIKSEARQGKDRIIVVIGPTASGKSDLAVRIALQLRSGRALRPIRQAHGRLARGRREKIGGEIISADSRQIYRGMDIGTGKITKKEMRGVPHHLLDVASPQSEFNASHFKKLAEKKIKEIIARGHVPIIAGGTGFWIDALVYDFNLPEIKPDKKLRAKLEKESVEKLFGRLEKLDPERAGNIDGNNKRRLVRALEVVLLSKKPVPKLSKKQKYDALFIGINPPRKILEAKIYKRLLGWLDQGLIKEIKKLRKSGVSWKRLDNFGLEYRYASRYIRGQLSYENMISETFKSIKNYAKRQMTWFRKNKEINWIKNHRELEKILQEFID